VNKTLQLKFIGNSNIKLTNLLTEEEDILQLKNGNLNCSMRKPAAFSFYKYEIIK